MKTTTGIVRVIDHLGRIVIPKEMCRTLQIKAGDPLEINMENGKIHIHKHEVACVFCDSREELKPFEGKLVCAACASKLAHL